MFFGLAERAPGRCEPGGRALNNVDFVKAVYAGFLGGGIDRILAAADPNIEWRSNIDPALLPWGGERKGLDQIMGYFSDLALNVEIETFAPREFLPGSGFVVVMGHSAGRMRTGVRFEGDWRHVFKILGGNVHAIGLPSSTLEPLTPRSH